MTHTLLFRRGCRRGGSENFAPGADEVRGYLLALTLNLSLWSGEGPLPPSSLILCHHLGVLQLPDFMSDTVDPNEPATHRGVDSSCEMALHPQVSLSSQVPICPALLFKLAAKLGYPARSVICQHGS